MNRTLSAILATITLLAAACRPMRTPPPATSLPATSTPARPAALEIHWPAPGEAVEAEPLLQWESFPGSTHYQVTVLDSGSAVVLEQDSAYPHFRVSPPLTKGAHYAWKVQAQDANHAVLAELSGQFSVKDDLVLVGPTDREAVDGTPLLQWKEFTGAAQYHVLIENGPADSPQVVLDQLVREAQFAVTPSLQPGSYRWSAEALDANQVVLAELKSEFSVKAHLELLDPADGAEVGASPTIRWVVFPGASRYEVIVLDASANPPAAVLDSTSRGTELAVNPPLKPNTKYSLTIRALDGDHRVVAESNSVFRVYAVGAFYDCGKVRALPAAECQVLVTLYQETAGPSWAGNADWLSTDAPCEWSGVTCTDGHVTDLYLSLKGMKGRLPSALADLTALRVLSLHDNQLTGSIPPEIGRLANLAELDLSRNQLTGSLPAEFDQLHGLEMLILHSNQLGGELPTTWQHLAALRHLDLSHNALTGAIPGELGQLRQLQNLRLGYNHLSGTIPAEIGQLEHLVDLDLSYNVLNGPVPEAILRLPTRALWGNQLDGTIRCDGASPTVVDFQAILFNCSASLATSIWPEVMPAIQPQESAPFWETRPEVVRFTLAGAPDAAPHFPLGAALSDQAQVLVYSVQDYNALDRAIRLQMRALQNLLDARPTTIQDQMPLLPLTNASQMLHARVHYLDFVNGSGVAYLTQFAMGPAPVNNQELFYTFQGLTADRNYFVAVFIPAKLPNLPDTAHMSDSEFAELMANYQTYLADTVAMLDGQPPEAYTPNLGQIDQMVESLVVQVGGQ